MNLSRTERDFESHFRKQLSDWPKTSPWFGVTLCALLAGLAAVVHTLPYPPFTIGDNRHPVSAVLLALLMGAYIFVYASRQKIGQTRSFEWSEFIRATRNGFLALATPMIVLGGIYSGIFSPTEAGAIAGIYAIVVTVFFYRELD